MKGLIIKDLMTMKKSLKIVVGIIIFYSAYSIIFNTNFIAMIPALLLILVMSTFSYDEYNHWDKIAMSMPISPKQVIGSKFILTFLLGIYTGVGGLILSLIYSLVKNVSIGESITALIGSVVACCAICFIIIPFFIKFGVEHGKLICILAIAAMVVLFYVIFRNTDMEQFGDISDALIISVIAVIFVLITAISYIVSVKIYSNKEF